MSQHQDSGAVALSVIVPAYNEETHIEATLRSIAAYLARTRLPCEVIVVANGCTDRTVPLVEALRSQVPGLILIDCGAARGKGLAVRRGLLAARGARRLLMDADNATTIDQLDTLEPWLDRGFDIVVGSIGVAGAMVAPGAEPWYRRMLGRAGNRVIQRLLLPGIHDTQRGFKLLTAAAAARVAPRLTVTGWAFDVELLAYARACGLCIKEVPVRWQNTPATSKVRLLDYPQFLAQVLRVRRRVRRTRMPDPPAEPVAAVERPRTLG